MFRLTFKNWNRLEDIYFQAVARKLNPRQKSQGPAYLLLNDKIRCHLKVHLPKIVTLNIEGNELDGQLTWAEKSISLKNYFS